MSGGIRNDPKGQGFPAVSGALIVDTYRGAMRVRSWPKKPSKPATAEQLKWRDWFKRVNRSAIQTAGQQQAIAITMAKGSGLYPRDVIVQSLSSGIFDVVDEFGNFMTQRWDFLEDCMFQGASCFLTVDQSISAAVYQKLVWPIPLIDTYSFWSGADPTRLTIPTGVEYVQLTAGARSTAFFNGYHRLQIKRNDTDYVAQNSSIGNQEALLSVTSGAIKVTAGDYFEAEVYMSGALALKAVPATFFTLNVLQATT